MVPRFYFYTNALKFTAKFIGFISLLDGFAQLLGAPFLVALSSLCRVWPVHADAVLAAQASFCTTHFCAKSSCARSSFGSRSWAWLPVSHSLYLLLVLHSLQASWYITAKRCAMFRPGVRGDVWQA